MKPCLFGGGEEATVTVALPISHFYLPSLPLLSPATYRCLQPLAPSIGEREVKERWLVHAGARLNKAVVVFTSPHLTSSPFSFFSSSLFLTSSSSHARDETGG
mmetsp:Transcript_16879/g.42369  ORF Transcript_16879/g.42369 Transcript_16879/m.42369 type:complete len:103 (-) Transcript_16879:216-524(-)